MTIQTLGARHERGLAVLFERNNTPEVVREFHPFPLDRRTAGRLCHHDGLDQYFVMVADDGVVGFAMLRGWDEGYEVPSFGVLVDRDHQGRGIAAALLDHALAVARLRLCPGVRLTVYRDNLRAWRCYMKKGFRQVSEAASENRTRCLMFRPLSEGDDGPLVYASTGVVPGKGTFIEHVRAMREHGLGYIELGNYDHVSAEDLAALAAVPARYLVHNYFPPPSQPFAFNLASPSAETVAASLSLAKRAIDLSVELGASVYSFHAGFIQDPIGRDDHGFLFPAVTAEERARASGRFLTNVKALCEHATARGVGLLVENNVCAESNKDKLLLQTPEEFSQLFDAVGGGDDVGILLDTGHLHVSARTYGFDPADFTARHGHRVKGVHLHDNDGRYDEHRPATLGGWAVGMLQACRPLKFVVVEAKFESLTEVTAYVARLWSHLSTKRQAEWN